MPWQRFLLQRFGINNASYSNAGHFLPEKKKSANHLLRSILRTMLIKPIGFFFFLSPVLKVFVVFVWFFFTLCFSKVLPYKLLYSNCSFHQAFFSSDLGRRTQILFSKWCGKSPQTLQQTVWLSGCNSLLVRGQRYAHTLPQRATASLILEWSNLRLDYKREGWHFFSQFSWTLDLNSSRYEALHRSRPGGHPLCG